MIPRKLLVYEKKEYNFIKKGFFFFSLYIYKYLVPLLKAIKYVVLFFYYLNITY